MSCIVAFLLIASSKYQTSNHLVFVTSDTSDNNYRVFAHHGNEFPQADDILMTTSPIEGTGTSTAVYCSVALEGHQIVARIKRSKMLQTDLAYKYINPQPDQPVTCWDNILATMSKHDRPRVNYSELEQTVCTPQTISYLSYTGFISVIGDYERFFPKKGSGDDRPFIVAERFSLDQLIEKGQIFRRTDWDKESIALAWYQGYLHLFEAGPNGWHPLTKIGHESENGRMILMYMLGTNPNIWDVSSHLSFRIDNYLKKLKEEGEFKQFYHHLLDTHHSHTLGNQLDLAKLQSFVPTGKISRAA
ncbi:unnamed protein product [Blumeria hordei]|uniref:Uncharacterized protein n=2 Tax=Blumeria hordei TaxID=2867405 RepID=A0A383V0H5_BLUHO|nr:CSEP0423 putative effector protein [Blumeria hordei DH14]SZF06113.1 unnamed protein product [Blumeria hordei]